ncbi:MULTISPECIES: glucokinase [unclassified Pseudoalteromonas]|uniref:glucokinase n=1 Tax=unclassified Pseudoalteromonas TaxID=194690 RepID=UPI000C08D9A9|nr:MULTISPECIES: glucokinase [unclassified Pseudoalteromonas]MDP2634835.1 glucokinase [Pseudoalteromonas sp. 1_MG-2023]PHN91433.1 glucokinase [Pseudoalteromonas sp. 3D05]TGE76655.1 glucokinase [Pseudoalteromonas sp. KS88]
MSCNPNTQFDPILVADIGGTNARFALITDFMQETNQFVIEHNITFPSADFGSLEAALTNYLSQIKPIEPKRACLAVAGPIKAGQVHLTNLGWHFSVEQLKTDFALSNLEVINDFAAFAYAAPYLDPQQNVTIKSGQADSNANIAVMGPGTGFGAASLVRTNQGSAVLSCEAGHISLASVNELDTQLITELRKQLPHVSVETVFSGPGISHLYQAMAAVKGVEPKNLTAAQISELANTGECAVCDATLNQFCDWIGSVAGDLALTFGGLGGVFIGGGILPRMQSRLLASRFVERFTAKGIMSQFVSQIPVTLVVQDNIPLIGAAACLHANEQV